MSTAPGTYSKKWYNVVKNIVNIVVNIVYILRTKMHVAGQIFLPAVEHRCEIHFTQYRTGLHCFIHNMGRNINKSMKFYLHRHYQ